MPKLKTHKGLSKRVKVTGTGKLMRRKAGKRHLLTSKSRSHKKSLGNDVNISAANEKNFKTLLVL